MKNKITSQYIPKLELLKYLKNPDLFLHHSWLTAIEKGLGYKCFGLLTEHNGVPIAVSSFFECKKGGFKLAGSPLPGTFSPYMDPVWLKNTDNDIKKDILLDHKELLRKKGFSYIEWRFSEDSLGKKLGNDLNCDISFPETFLLEIEPDFESMWKKIQPRNRTKIKKAEKLGVTLIENKGTLEEIDIFYNMLKGVFAKSAKLPPHPVSFYKSIVKNLMPENRLLILSALLDNKPIAMGFFNHDKSKIHFLGAASLPEAYETRANNLIHWGVIKYAVKKGLKLYDLGGKGIPSIDKFKSIFGATTHKHSRIVWRSKAALVAEKIFLAQHSLRGKMNRLSSKMSR